MLGERDELLSEVRAWAGESELDIVDFGFLRLRVIDMRGDMDTELGLVTRQRSEFSGRVCSGIFPVSRCATLAYRGVDTEANRALIEWARDNGFALDYWDGPTGDHFACRYETYLTDQNVEPHKKQWKIELAIKLAD